MLEISKREQHLSHAGSSWLAQTRAWHGAPPRGCPSAWRLEICTALDQVSRSAFRAHQWLSSLLVSPPCAPSGAQDDLAPVHL